MGRELFSNESLRVEKLSQLWFAGFSVLLVCILYRIVCRPSDVAPTCDSESVAVVRFETMF